MVCAKLMTCAWSSGVTGSVAQSLESVDQRVREAVQAVSVLHDALALHVVQNFANLLRQKIRDDSEKK